MLNLTLYAYSKRNTAKFLTEEIAVSSMEEFEIGYQTFLFTIPYEKFHLDVVNNNDTTSDEELNLYNNILDVYC